MLNRSSTAAGLTATALALTGALPSLAAGQDLRSPDARDVAAQVAAGQDLRSPDTRDIAARAATRTGGTAAPHDTNPAAVTYEDLRSPDARDAARGVLPSASVRVVRVVTPAPTGIDWTDAAIGATTAFGVALLVAAGLISLNRRRVPTT